MAAEIITKEDLSAFEDRLLDRIKGLIGQTVEQPKKWLRSAQVRKLLNISPGTLTNMRINGIIKFSKVGGIMYYSNEDITKMMSGK